MTGVRYSIGLLIGLLSASVGGFALGRLSAQPEQHVTSGQSPQSATTTPDEFLHYASSVGEAEPLDSHRSELLRAIALRRQRAEPGSARATWKVLREAIGTAAVSGDDASRLAKILAQLVTFQDALDDTLLNCDTVVLFDDVWMVRQEVEEEIMQRRKAIAENLRRVMPQVPQSTKPGSVEAVTQTQLAFAKFLTDQNASVLLLVATTPAENPDSDLSTVFTTEDGLRETVHATIEHEKDSIRAFRQQLLEGTLSPIEPAESDNAARHTIGQCEEWRLRLAELEDAIAQSDLDSWRQLRQIVEGSGKSMPRLDGHTPGTERPLDREPLALSKTLAELQAELRQIQAAAYNLWALRELEAAETVDSWDSRLARIDHSILEPSVSAIYSSVYSRRIDAVKDPEQRSRLVQRLLSSERLPLTTF